ncbi:PREDICTED: ubiquitin carboxyl-terminal hydrolase 64E isoform X2 [Rhagoletis zephyria]|uniref:ubiquitin carboxyl-terminal hydrolase 64E isoform X2 n=1 Tax=Rhagoletis zephyria TaxID=28612 RepID=UPI000811277E|nr:PREDICTED: ubiquitin carboxyl-terminal hydrolase 64E isoform X2 [Rhagoletis zephyria]
MDNTNCSDMVQLEPEKSTQCVVHDLTPKSEQKKINIVVRSQYTVEKVFRNISTQYPYELYDLVLQPNETENTLIHLNARKSELLFAIPGFAPQEKNVLVLLPPGVWDGNVKKRFDFAKPLTKKKCISKSSKLSTKETSTATIKAAQSPSTTDEKVTTTSIVTNGVDSTAASINSAMNGDSEISAHSADIIANNNHNESLVTKNICTDLNGAGDASSTTTDELSSSLHTATVIASTRTTNTATMAHSLKLSPLSDPELLSDDDLALGASASPTETEPYSGDGLLKIRNTSPRSPKYGPLTEGEMYQQMTLHRDFTRLGKKLQPTSASASTTTSAASGSTTMSTMYTGGANGYVGLVNQAMTCYLNSLLQALFMTPEFRNALYRWEFDNDNEAKNIPYQLQKLFLNLQTSKKSAVETTDLTRSFGWDSTEAWQQHDIQELCRVMFDALEHKFKNTKQMNLIASLYEGKMIDYVKCLECNTEKTRADTFLDIPLPVRPFGSTVAYGSIEEALRAFVQPETLDGNNQYFCEKCNKKCDAHKGLKFKNFPYILTLHLKRFDFDYQTMHRIKLNDKVTFPQTLNLNSFINPADQEGHAPATSASATVGLSGGNATSNSFMPNGTIAANDDCSTTDSGSAMEEDLCCSGTATASSSQHENDMNDDDEGIDMSTSTDHRVTSSNASVEQRIKHNTGPYLYELFAIMIHSGSASGGHYYAYIKEFDNNEWYCFNDQTVSPITEEDIEKSFGGGSSRAYYSSVYSSSTNAYMLMYRQIDPQRNERATKATDFPEHINHLLPKLHQEEETRVTRSSGRHGVVVSDLSVQELVKPRVNFYNPELKKMKSTRVYVSNFNVNSVLESAYQLLNIEQFAPLSRCRLVVYDDMGEQICQSLEHISDPSLTELRRQTDGPLEFLLETKVDGQEFEVYKPGGVTWNVYIVNVWKMHLDGPHLVYAPTREANSALLHSIAVRLNLNENQLLLATVKTDAFVALDSAPPNSDTAEGMQQQVITQEDLQEIAQEQFRGLTYIFLNVPNTDPTTLEILGIPALETPTIEVSADVVDAVQMNSNVMHTINPSIGENTSTLSQKNCHPTGSARESPLPPVTCPLTGQESNSEDSSLSDGDRTLVESMHNRYGGDSQISSTSHSPYLSSPEDDAYNKANSLKRIHDLFQMAPDHTIDSSSQSRSNSAPQFFYAEKLNAVDPSTISSSIHSSSTNDPNEELARKPTHSYKIIVDPHMKMSTFTRHVESLIGVPSNYFKLQHKYEVIDLMSTVLFVSMGETLSIELGKVLQPDEHKAKISFMRLSELDNDTGKLPCICEWVYKASMTVGEAKKELIAKLHRIDAKYKSLSLSNCRLWLKGGRNPIKIMSDDETLGTDLRSSVAAEFLVQECEDGVNPQVGEDSLTIFVRRWYADKLQLDKFQEITLEKNSEIREELAKITDIRQEHIAYSKINGSFPCTNISLLSINSTLSWFSIPATLDKYPLTTTVNGNVYFYKDVTKAPKEPTTEERRELSAREKLRLDRLGCMSTSLYSPRRERALKIYLDSPQSNNNSSTTTSSSSGSAVVGASRSAED